MVAAPPNLAPRLGSPKLPSARGLGAGLGVNIINPIYKAFLNREADKEGLAHYMSATRSGVGAAQIADELMRSKEFRDYHRGT